VRVPVAAGLKTTAAVHWLPAARVEPQELDPSEKSAAFAPAMATLLMVIAEPVKLERVADCEALLDPTLVDAKVRLDGVTVMFVEPAPVPVRATACGLLPALSVNRRVAVRVPLAVGLKTTAAVHWLPAARVEPQELDATAKSPAFVPEIATLLIVMAEADEFESVANCEELLDPTVVEANVRFDGVAEMLVEPAPVPVRETICGLFVALSTN
jgi:hypothetical protein